MAAAERSESAPSLPVLEAVASPAGVLVLVFAVLVLGGSRLLNDPDTFWHIAAGDWIWSHESVPASDPFSYSLAGAPWTAHEWLAELIFAGAYRTLGWSGVVLLAAAAIAASFAVLTRALNRVLAPKVTFALVALSFYLAAAHLTARPHVLAMPILAFWAVALLRARQEERAPSLALLPLMVLWANLHGGFVVGLGLTVVFAADAVFSATELQRMKVLRQWSIFVAGAALASWVNPHGPALWLFPLHLLRLDFALSFVGEWHAPDLSHLQAIEICVLALLALACFVRLRLAPLRLLLLLGLVHMALSHSRNAELLALLVPLLLMEPLAAGWSAAATGPISARRSSLVIPAILLALAGGAALARGYSNDETTIAPGQAFEAAMQAGVSGPVFNDFDFGGYLIFKGVPVLVDGRIDLYGDQFLRDYAAALDNTGDALPRYLDRNHITWALLEPQRPAVSALDRLPNWQRLYGDETAVAYVRRKPSS